MLKLRLKLIGRRGQPCYRIIVTDSRVKRDGRAIEEVGFYNPITKETHQPPVEEGDILMFPGFLFHRSPKNQSSEMKSVIAFNASYG